MAFVQEAYPDGMRAAVAGMIANSETQNVITHTADGSIPFGQPVVRTGDHTCDMLDEQTLTAVGAAGVPAPAGATITAAPTTTKATDIGVYQVVCVTAGATGKWDVFGPDGGYRGEATTGTPATIDGLTFTITDAGTDPAVGERFTITVSSDGAGLLGISVRDTSLDVSNADTYLEGDNVAIETLGPIWVTAGASVTAGQKAYWDESDNRFTNIATDYPLPSWVFDSSGGDGNLVRLARR